MRKWSFLALLLLVVLVGSSICLGAVSHTVTVTVPGFARVSVTGDASVTIVEGDYAEDGTVTNHAFDVNSTLTMRTNETAGMSVTATASSANFSDGGTLTFPVSQAEINVTGGGIGWVALAAAPGVEVANVAGKQNNADYAANFRISLDGSEDPATYTVTVTYSAAVNP